MSLGDHRDVDAGVEAAQRGDVGRREGDEVLLELVARRRRDVPSVPRLLEPAARPDPDLAKPASLKKRWDVASRRSSTYRVARGLVAVGVHDHDGVDVVARGQPEEVRSRAEAEVGVVGADLQAAARHDEGLAREARADRRAPRGGALDGRVGRLLDRAIGPVAGHVLDERSGERRSVRPRPDPVVALGEAPRRRRARGTSCRRGSPLKCTGCTRRARGVRSPRGTRRRGRCPAAHAQGRRCGPGHGDATEALGVRRARAPRRACSDVVTRRSRRARRASDRVRRAPSAASDDGRHHRRHCVKFPSEAQQHRWYRVARLIR